MKRKPTVLIEKKKDSFFGFNVPFGLYVHNFKCGCVQIIAIRLNRLSHEKMRLIAASKAFFICFLFLRFRKSSNHKIENFFSSFIIFFYLFFFFIVDHLFYICMFNSSSDQEKIKYSIESSYYPLLKCLIYWIKFSESFSFFFS